MAFIGFLFFGLSLIGYSSVLRLLKINPYFTWIDSILIQIIMLYCFAMLNLLRPGIWIVTTLGFMFLVGRLVLGYLGKVSIHHEGIHLYDVWMIFLGTVMAVVLLHSPLIHYDNFSHWATIVKFLTYNGYLPRASDTIISFTSYPPATALFITQFVTFTGFHEGTMLVAQFILIWAASYTIFSTLRDRTRGLNSMILCLTIALSYVFNINIRLNNLLVDYVLAILTVAGLVSIYIYRTDWKMMAGHVALFTGTLLLVKNSAVFFVIIIFVYYLYVLIQQTHANKLFNYYWNIICKFVTTLIISVLPFIWWEIHVHLTFTSSKHEISASAYHSQLAHDGIRGLLDIGSAFLHQIFNISSLSTQGFLVLNIGLIFGWGIIKYVFHHPNNLLKVLKWLDVITIVYYFSLYGMYVLSMPFTEAITLDGFERYMSSVVVLNLFIAMMFLVYVIDKTYYEQNVNERSPQNYQSIWTKNSYQLATFLVMFFAIIMMYSEINGTTFTNNYNRQSTPVMLANVTRPWTKQNTQKILIVDPRKVEVSTYYAGYLANYYFFSNNSTGQSTFSKNKKDFIDNIQKYDYVVIPKYDKKFSNRVKKIYHEKIKAGFFRVDNNGLNELKKNNNIKYQ